MKKYGDYLSFLLFALVTCYFAAIPGFAQQDYTDSLKQIIKGLPDNSEKAENLINLSKAFLNADSDSALFYGEQARTLAAGLDFKEAIVDADLIMGRVLKSKSQLADALLHFERALQEALLMDDSLRIAKASYNAGNIQYELSDYNNALANFNRSLAFYLVLNDSLGIMANYNLKGVVHHRMSSYDSAVIYLNKAINIGELAGYQSSLGLIYNNLGDVFLELNQFENARKYVLKSKEINEKSRNLSSLALNYILLGRIESDAGNFSGALENYRQAEELYAQTGDPLHLYDILNNIGVLYKAQNNPQSASQYYARALDGYRKMDYVRGIIVVLGNQADIYSKSGRYTEAAALNDTVLRLSALHGYGDYRKDAFRRISDDYFKQEKFRQAFEYQSKFYELKDSIFNIEKEKLINDLVFRYEKEKDQARILALEKDNLEKDLNLQKRTTQRNAYLYSGITIIALALFLFLYIQQKRVKDRIIARQKIHQLEEEKKLMAAKLLVEGQENERKRIATELHDGLGVLLSATKMQFSTIRDKSPENKELIEKATRMLEQATGDVRKISHNMMPGLLTKLGFYEAVEDLFEHIDDTKSLNATCTITGNQDRLAENKEIMLYRIVQEMVNNSMKHAGAKNIKLQVQVFPGTLDIVYADDGTGFDYRQQLETGSLGLKSMQSRVDFLNGKLLFDSKPGEGIKYMLQIPV